MMAANGTSGNADANGLSKEDGATVAAAGVDVEEIQTGKVWRDDRWLMENHLNRETVLDYFALSDWYDNTCLTAYCKMQSQLSGLQMDTQVLERMPGIDYELVPLADKSQASLLGSRLFVIDKVKRFKDPAIPSSSNKKLPQVRLTSYYVLDGSVFMCPALQKLLSAKILTISHFIKQSLSACQEHFGFSLSGGHRLSNGEQTEDDPEGKIVLAFGATPSKQGPLGRGIAEDLRFIDKMQKALPKLQQASRPQQQQQQQQAVPGSTSVAGSEAPPLSAQPSSSGGLVTPTSQPIGTGMTPTAAGMKRAAPSPTGAAGMMSSTGAKRPRP